MKLVTHTWKKLASGEVVPATFRMQIGARQINESGLADKELQAEVSKGKIILTEKRFGNGEK